MEREPTDEEADTLRQARENAGEGATVADVLMEAAMVSTMKRAARPTVETISPEEAAKQREHTEAALATADLNRRTSRALVLNAWIRQMQTRRGPTFFVGAVDIQSLEAAELALEGVPATDPAA